MRHQIITVAVGLLLAWSLSYSQASADEPLPVSEAHQGLAEEEKEPDFFTVTTSVGIYSAYMFRSQNLYDGLSFQPSVQGTFNLEDYGNLSLIHWMHLPGQGEQYLTRFVEVDEAIAYDYTWEDVTLTLSHYWYFYPNGNENTFPDSREFVATVSWDTFLQPSFTFADEYHSYKVQYYEAGIKHTFEELPISGLGNLTLFANAGFATNGTPYWSNNGFVQSTYGMSTELSLGDVTVTPLLAYSNGADEFATDQWWGGVSIGLSF